MSTYDEQVAYLERTGEMHPEVAAQWSKELQDRSDADFEIECMDRAMGGSPVATEMDSEREYVYNYGMEHPDHAWINSPRDCCYANPHYVGPPMPHPDDLDDEYRNSVYAKEDAEAEAMYSREVAKRDNDAPWFDEGEGPSAKVHIGLPTVEYDDGIPF